MFLHHNQYYNYYLMDYYAEVTVPDDARVYMERNKVKADKIEIKQFIPFLILKLSLAY